MVFKPPEPPPPPCGVWSGGYGEAGREPEETEMCRVCVCVCVCVCVREESKREAWSHVENDSRKPLAGVSTRILPGLWLGSWESYLLARTPPTDLQLSRVVHCSDFPEAPYAVTLGVSFSLSSFTEGQPLSYILTGCVEGRGSCSPCPHRVWQGFRHAMCSSCACEKGQRRATRAVGARLHRGGSRDGKSLGGSQP